MTTTRRSLFGVLAGAPVAVATAKDQQPEPEFYVGQIRAVHSHYEARPMVREHTWPAGAGLYYSQPSLVSESVAVTRNEQWNGAEWVAIETSAEGKSDG